MIVFGQYPEQVIQRFENILDPNNSSICEKRYLNIFTFTGIVLGFVYITFLPLGAYFYVPASINYQVVERYSLKATGAKATVALGILLPQSGPYQVIENREITWRGEQSIENSPCVDTIKLSGQIQPSLPLEAIIKYNVSVTHGFVVWRAEPDSCQLLPQCMIESDHPRIIHRANQNTNGNSWRDAFKIYNFSGEYLVASGEYAGCTQGKFVLEAYLSGHGECGEYSRLMVALSRASEIPSIVVSGILLPDFSAPESKQTRIGDHPGIAHAWVEFSDREIWTLADPAWGVNAWKGYYFGRNDGRHLSYGCINHEGEVYSRLHRWADLKGKIVSEEFAALKYVASSPSGDVEVTPQINVIKGWDGRWANAAGSLAIATVLLYNLRKRI